MIGDAKQSIRTLIQFDDRAGDAVIERQRAGTRSGNVELLLADGNIHHRICCAATTWRRDNAPLLLSW